MGGGEEEALATVESEAYLPWLAGWQTHPQERACFFLLQCTYTSRVGAPRVHVHTHSYQPAKPLDASLVRGGIVVGWVLPAEKKKKIHVYVLRA